MEINARIFMILLSTKNNQKKRTSTITRRVIIITKKMHIPIKRKVPNMPHLHLKTLSKEKNQPNVFFS